MTAGLRGVEGGGNTDERDSSLTLSSSISSSCDMSLGWGRGEGGERLGEGRGRGKGRGFRVECDFCKVWNP